MPRFKVQAKGHHISYNTSKRAVSRPLRRRGPSRSRDASSSGRCSGQATIIRAPPPHSHPPRTGSTSQLEMEGPGAAQQEPIGQGGGRGRQGRLQPASHNRSATRSASGSPRRPSLGWAEALQSRKAAVAWGLRLLLCRQGGAARLSRHLSCRFAAQLSGCSQRADHSTGRTQAARR